MKDITIVGAGLSGLSASIILAREGHRVTVLERESRIGGTPRFRPDPAGYPFDLEGIERYTGIDIRPAVKEIGQSHVWAYGRCYDGPVSDSVPLHMIERGPRESSIDSLLYREARACGVDFEFDHPVMSQGDFAQLPPDTIVATGLQIEPYEALDVPYSPLYGFFAKGTVDHERTTVALLFDDFTRDYAFTCTINGLSFALLYQTGIPLSREARAKFARMVAEGEGLEFSEWNDLLGGAYPVASIRNPRLFQGNKILIGACSGMIDPFLFFGMQGAILSGRIAAKALQDKKEAYDDFKRAVSTYYRIYLQKRLWNLLPDAVRRPILRTGLWITPYIEEFLLERFVATIPGRRLLYH